jgi:hypothetical protein
MIRVPGEKPHVPPPITPKEAKGEKKAEEKGRPAKAPSRAEIGRGPEMDARAIAVRLAALAAEAKEKEVAAEEFERILEEVIQLTGLKEPEAALAEANRRLQKEIELELERIKSNKELMEEADGWQRFAELLSQMSEEQVEAFIGLLKGEIKAL